MELNENTNINSEGKKFKISRWAKISLTVFFSIILVAVIIITMALQDSNSNTVEEPASDKLIGELVKGAVLDQDVDLELSDINGFLTYIKNQRDLSGDDSDLSVKYMQLKNIKGDNTMLMYMPILYKDIELGLTSKLKASFNQEKNRIELEMLDTKIGALSVSSKMFREHIENALPNGLYTEDDKIIMDSSFDFDFQGYKLKLNIEKFETQDNSIVIKTTGVMNEVKSLINNKISELLK